MAESNLLQPWNCSGRTSAETGGSLRVQRIRYVIKGKRAKADNWTDEKRGYELEMQPLTSIRLGDAVRLPYRILRGPSMNAPAACWHPPIPYGINYACSWNGLAYKCDVRSAPVTTPKQPSWFDSQIPR